MEEIWEFKKKKKMQAHLDKKKDERRLWNKWGMYKRKK